MKKLFLLLSVLAVAVLPAFSLEMGARPVAMGGAFAGLADDANAIFLNPAGIGYLKGESAAVSSRLSDGRESTILGGVEGTSFGSFGVGYVSSSVPIDSYDETATMAEQGEAPVKSIDQALVLSYARQLNDFMVIPKFMGELSLGANLKLLSNRVNNAKGLASEQSSGFDLDLAAVFRPNQVLSYGFSVRNLIGVRESNEPKLVAGISGKLLNDSLIVSLDSTGVGCEVKIIPELALRAGRSPQYTTAGFGVSLGGFGVDYAYQAAASPVHYVGISLAVEPPADLKQASLAAE